MMCLQFGTEQRNNKHIQLRHEVRCMFMTEKNHIGPVYSANLLGWRMTTSRRITTRGTIDYGGRGENYLFVTIKRDVDV
ncbi:hypothetical protein KC19_VG284300 [Ceratodon purpureus]|uniref:Uncharacterized protein n=1 Tax=Ceratodon purpureus TaxID=3225 RepID=A0A8T0HWA9_CERPU|nr:hypothetical protein KC19_VG284300 [Ceratodon purpureus]